MPYSVFYIISEYPKIEHVPDKVKPPAVEKHEGYQGQNRSSKEVLAEQLGIKKPGRHNPITGYKIRQACTQSELIEKHQTVYYYQGVVDYRNSSGWNGISQRDHGIFKKAP